MIPKILLQTSKTKLDQYALDITKSFIDDSWTYMHFVDSEIIQFFEQNPLKEFPDIVDVFNNIQKGEYKSDLFRYYYLFINGGVYIDSDFELTKPLDKIVEEYNLIVVESGCELATTINCLFNGFLGCEPNNKIIYEALVDIYNTFKNKKQPTYYEQFCVNLYNITDIHKNSYKIKYFKESDLGHSAVIYDPETYIRFGIHYHVDGFINPVEFRIKKINELYKKILKRNADKSGLRFYVNSGLPLSDIQQALFNCDENNFDYDGGVPINLNLYNLNYDFYIHNPKLDKVISLDILLTGCWERKLSDIWMQHIQPGDLVVDIGANIGWYSKLATLKGATTISIEPDLKNLAVLKNNIPNSEIHEVCLGSSVGEVELSVVAPQNRGSTQIMQNYDTRTAVEVFKCRMDTLDNIIGDRYNKIKAIKMDVEGYELEVLKGAKNTIENLPSGCLVIFEVVTTENFFIKDFDFLINKFENVYVKSSDGHIITLEELDKIPKNYSLAMGKYHFDIVGVTK